MLRPPNGIPERRPGPDDVTLLVRAFLETRDERILAAVHRWAAPQITRRASTLTRAYDVPTEDLEAAGAHAFHRAVETFAAGGSAPFPPHFERLLRRATAEEAMRFGRLSGESRGVRRARAGVALALAVIERDAGARARVVRRDAPPRPAVPPIGPALARVLAAPDARAAQRGLRASLGAALDACAAFLTAALPPALPEVGPLEVATASAWCLRECVRAVAVAAVRRELTGAPPGVGATPDGVDAALARRIAEAFVRLAVWGRRAVTDPGDECWAEVAARRLMTPERARALHGTGHRALRLDAPAAFAGDGRSSPRRGVAGGVLADVVAAPGPVLGRAPERAEGDWEDGNVDGWMHTSDGSDDDTTEARGERLADARAAFARLLPTRQWAVRLAFKGLPFSGDLVALKPALSDARQALGASFWVLAAAADARRGLWAGHPARRLERRVQRDVGAWIRAAGARRPSDGPPERASERARQGAQTAPAACVVATSALRAALRRLGFGGLARGRRARGPSTTPLVASAPGIGASLAWWDAAGENALDEFRVASSDAPPRAGGTLLVTVAHAGRGLARAVVGTTAVPACGDDPDGSDSRMYGAAFGPRGGRGDANTGGAGQDALAALAGGRVVPIGTADARALWGALARARACRSVRVAGEAGGLALAWGGAGGHDVVARLPAGLVGAARRRRASSGAAASAPASAPASIRVRASVLIRAALRVAGVSAYESAPRAGRDAALGDGDLWFGVGRGVAVAAATGGYVVWARARVVAPAPQAPDGAPEAPGWLACTLPRRIAASLSEVFAPEEELTLVLAGGVLSLSGARTTIQCASAALAPPDAWPIRTRAERASAVIDVRDFARQVHAALLGSAPLRSSGRDSAVVSGGIARALDFLAAPRAIVQCAAIQRELFGPPSTAGMADDPAVVVPLAALKRALAVVPATRARMSLGELAIADAAVPAVIFRPVPHVSGARRGAGAPCLGSGEDAWSAVVATPVTGADDVPWGAVVRFVV